jgi:hypothetical protein
LDLPQVLHYLIEEVITLGAKVKSFLKYGWFTVLDEDIDFCASAANQNNPYLVMTPDALLLLATLPSYVDSVFCNERRYPQECPKRRVQGQV